MQKEEERGRLARGVWRPYLFSVAQTSKSAVSRVSKPAGRHATKPTGKSAIQQVWKPALRKIARCALNKYWRPAKHIFALDPIAHGDILSATQSNHFPYLLPFTCVLLRLISALWLNQF